MQMTTTNVAASAFKRFEINFIAADVADVTNQAIIALNKTNSAFSHGGRVVHVVTLPAFIQNGQKRFETIFTPTKVPHLSDIISRVAVFKDPKQEEDKPPKPGQEGRLRKVKSTSVGGMEPPRLILEAILSRQGGGLNPLTRISGNPVIREDGSVVQSNGYDETTGIYVRLDAPYPTVPDQPTHSEAIQALAELRMPFRGFPFVSSIDETVALSGILTGLVGSMLPAKPAIGVNSYVAATGKTLLINTISMIVTGARLSQVTEGSTAAEKEKRVDSLLLDGHPLLGIDNISGSFGDDKLCTAVTSPVVAVRPLGRSEIARVRTPQLFLNGNNLQPKGDFARRMLFVDLDAGVDDPSKREFDFHADAEALADRPRLVTAALTILRAYHVAGRPKSGLPPVGSFEAWGRWIRDALVWVGQPDIAVSINRVRNRDPERIALLSILTGWQNILGTQKLRTVEVIAQAAEAARDPQRAEAADFLEALSSVAGELDGSISPVRLGTYLGRSTRRNVAGRRLEQSVRDGNNRWQLHLEE
jgi:putative DNA primase/helicase